MDQRCPTFAFDKLPACSYEDIFLEKLAELVEENKKVELHATTIDAAFAHSSRLYNFRKNKHEIPWMND